MVQVGDIVRVVDTAEHGENGWEDCWVGPMNDTLGMVGEVFKNRGDHGFDVAFHFICKNFNYPSHVLRKVGQGRWSILS